MSDMDLHDSVAQPGDTPQKVRYNLTCPIHGDVTQSTLIVSLENLEERGKPLADGEKKQPMQYLYCMHCINDLLLQLQKDDKLPKVMAIPIEEDQSSTDKEKEETK